MKQIDLYIENEDEETLHYKVQVAVTDEEKRKGLQGVKELPIDEGMLFVYDDVQKEVSYWMKGVDIPLRICFIDEDMNVISVRDMLPDDGEKRYIEENVKYVLEVNAGEPIYAGDDVDFDLDAEMGLPDESDLPPMLVLDENGNTQMEMRGNERVVSRKQTVILIRKAKLCRKYKNRNKSKYEKYCRALGRYMFKVIKQQDNREPEYVKTK